MNRRRSIIAICIAALLLALVIGESLIVGTASSQATNLAPRAIENVQSHFAPMDYFEARCAGCHGPHGSFYGESFARELSDEKLIEVVREMTEGPAGEPLDGAHLRSLVAYHRSLIDRKPFIALTSFQSEKDGGLMLRGEVTEESEVELMIGEKHVDARVDGFAWSAKTPEKTGRNDIRIVARKGAAQTTLHLREALHSHDLPRAATRKAAP